MARFTSRCRWYTHLLSWRTEGDGGGCAAKIDENTCLRISLSPQKHLRRIENHGGTYMIKCSWLTASVAPRSMHNYNHAPCHCLIHRSVHQRILHGWILWHAWVRWLCGDYRVGHRLCLSHPGDDEDTAESDGDGQETQQTIQTTVGIVCLELRLELEHTLATCWTRRIDGARVATLAAIDV
jgi:hypothetical protein